MAATTPPPDTTSKEMNYKIFNIEPEQRHECSNENNNIQEIFCSFKEEFEKEGFLLVRGLLDESVLERLRSVGKAICVGGKSLSDKFSSVQFGSVFSLDETVFREAALRSAIPSVLASLLDVYDRGLGSDNTPITLRVLKDAFLAKGMEENHCGWHVDDSGFWPTDANSCGINVWIALDDMPSKYGGGLALSPRSHKADWKERAYETIGSTPTLPLEGVDPKSMFFKTCAMESLNQELNSIIEASKVEFDYQPGDCLFLHRWLFHRSVRINEAGLDFYKDQSPLSRYTIRYERGSAKLIRGFSMEPCVLMNPENSGKSLDDICTLDGPFYPRCWPPLDEENSREQESKIEFLAREILPAALSKKSQMLQGMFAVNASGDSKPLKSS